MELPKQGNNWKPRIGSDPPLKILFYERGGNLMALNRTPRGNAVYQPDGAVLTEYLWDRSKLTVIQGPVGSGTSSCSSHRIWLLANEQEPDYDGVRRTRWIIGRRTYKELRTTILKTWLEWFPEDYWGQIERSEPMSARLKEKHPSGDGTTIDCEVIFLALPDEQTAENVLASFEITGFFYTEAQFVELGVITELLSRCARYPSMKNGPGATWYGGFCDLNAPTEGHWIPYMRGDIPIPPDWSDAQKAQFVKPDGWNFLVQPPGLIEEIVGQKIQYRENPLAENQRWLKESYLEKIMGWDRDKIDRRVLNKVGLAKNGMPVYPTFMQHDHVMTDEMEPIPGLPIIVGTDAGREPAAVFMQNRGSSWYALSELIGSNESAALFAPRVARHISQKYPGFEFEFFGDPRGGDKGQNVETTAYDIFMAEGMMIVPATTDNNPEIRRSTVSKVLERRGGLNINPSCLTLKTGMAGGYHFRKVAGIGGGWTEKPHKGPFSHIVEAMENALMGGGEAYAVTTSPNVVRLKPIAPAKRKVQFRGHR